MSQFAWKLQLVEDGKGVLHEYGDAHCRHGLALSVGYYLRVDEAHEVDGGNHATILPTHSAIHQVVSLSSRAVYEIDCLGHKSHCLNYFGGSWGNLGWIILDGYYSSLVFSFFVELSKLFGCSLQS